MDAPKQKPKMTKPKALDKSKLLIDKTKQSLDKPRERSADEYATQRTEQAGKKVGSAAVKGSTTVAKKGVQQMKKSYAKSKAKKATEKNTSGKSAGFTTAGKAKTSEKATAVGKGAVKSVSSSVKAGQKGMSNPKIMYTAGKKKFVTGKTTSIVKNKAGKAARKAGKALTRMVRMAAKSIKGLIMMLGSGGSYLAVMIAIIAVVAYVILSPFAIFFGGGENDTPTISQLVAQIDSDYSATIANIVVDAGEVDEIVMDGESDALRIGATNWIDVLSVFAVKLAGNQDEQEFMDLLTIDDAKENMLKSVFWDMNSITHEIQEVEIELEDTQTPTGTPEPSASPTPEPTPEVFRSLVINEMPLTYLQAAQLYEFTEEQNDFLEEMMSPNNIAMFMEICGMDTFSGLSPEQAAQLINSLPEKGIGADVVRFAITRLGDPYSRQLRGQGSFVDCSYLARWCYQQAGVTGYTASTAAEQARYCIDNEYTIRQENLQIGDLIFWSFKINGRYKNISHVGIYVGDNYVIDASSARGMVVYRELFGEGSIVVCARPYEE